MYVTVKGIVLFLWMLLTAQNAWAATNYCNDASAKVCVKMHVDESPVQDSGALNHDGNLDSANNPDFVADGPSGYTQGSYYFTSDKISFGDSTDYQSHTGASGVISLVAWVKFNTFNDSAGQRQWIVTKGNTAFEFGLYERTASAGNYFIRGNVWTSGGADVMIATGTTGLSTGTWYHVAMTYDRAIPSLKVYLNGVEEATSSSASSESSAGTDAMLLAARGDGAGAAADHYITEFGLFSRVLTQPEIQEIKNNGLDGTFGSHANTIQNAIIRNATIN